jgi:hypothetical protein
MTQIAQFALVLVGVAVASIWALAKGRLKWFLLIVGAFVAWVVLPSVILQVEWGYYREDGAGMASDKWNIFKTRSIDGGRPASRLAAEVCGDAEGFDTKDPSLQLAIMPEQALVEHFFRLSKYSNRFWVGVGWKDRYCLARYLATDTKDFGLTPLPTQLFPFPFFPWISFQSEVEERLIERLRLQSTAPEGMHSLLPGQCMTGNIAKGDTLRFRVEMPYFGQKIRLLFRDGDCEHQEHPLATEWSKNGQRISGTIDETGTGGVYQIDLHASGNGERHYQVGLYWGMEPRCGVTEWREGCPNLELERYRQRLKDEGE